MPYDHGFKTNRVCQLPVIDTDTCHMLFPTHHCYELGIVMKTPNNIADWSYCGTQLKITVEPSGHTAINLCELNPEG